MKVLIEQECHPCEATVRFATLLRECLAIFDERHHVRGVDNINAKEPEWLLGLVQEKIQRALSTIAFMRQRGSTDDGYKELRDSCIDAANLALMTFMKVRGLWPATNESDRIATAEGVPPSTSMVGGTVETPAKPEDPVLADIYRRLALLEAKQFPVLGPLQPYEGVPGLPWTTTNPPWFDAVPDTAGSGCGGACGSPP